MSFLLVCFHFVIGCVCLCPGPVASAINEGGWGFKFLIVLVCFMLFWFIPDTFFYYYSYVCKVASFVF